MEVYQPLNSYSFCKTNDRNITARQGSSIQARQYYSRNTRHSHVSQKESVKKKRTYIANPFLYKVVASAIVIFVLLIATLIVKIEASEPISFDLVAGEQQIVVGSGDNFWKLATTHYPEVEDKGFAIYLIKERNGINHNDIYPGETIILPIIE